MSTSEGAYIEPPRAPEPEITQEEVARAEAQVNWAISSSDSDGEKMEKEAVAQSDLVTSQSESEWDRDDLPIPHPIPSHHVEVGELLGLENTPETSTFSFESLNVGMSEEAEEEAGFTEDPPANLAAEFDDHFEPANFEQPKKMAQMAPVALGQPRSRSSSSSSSSGSFSSG